MNMRRQTLPVNDVFGRVLSLNSLHPDVARFHLSGESTVGTGTFLVERGNKLANAVASALHLPRSGHAVSVSIRIDREVGCERWRRSFDGQPLETVQRLHRGNLVEHVGCVGLGLRAVARSSALVVELTRVGLVIGGRYLPFPGRLGLRIRAQVSAGREPGSVHVVVEISSVLGRLAKYQGALCMEQRQ